MHLFPGIILVIRSLGGDRQRDFSRLFLKFSTNYNIFIILYIISVCLCFFFLRVPLAGSARDGILFERLRRGQRNYYTGLRICLRFLSGLSEVLHAPICSYPISRLRRLPLRSRHRFLSPFSHRHLWPTTTSSSLRRSMFTG